MVKVSSVLAVITLSAAGAVIAFSIAVNRWFLQSATEAVFWENAMLEAEKIARETASVVMLGDLSKVEQKARDYVALWIYGARGDLLHAFGNPGKPRFLPVEKPKVVYLEPGKVHVVVPIPWPVSDAEILSGGRKRADYLYVVLSTHLRDKIIAADNASAGVAAAGSLLTLAIISVLIFKLIQTYTGKLTEKLSLILETNELTEENKIPFQSRILEIQLAINTYNTAIDRLIQLDLIKKSLLANLRLKAEANIQRQQQMAAIIAHEMRTPIVSLKMGLSRLVDYVRDIPDETVSEYLLEGLIQAIGKVDVLRSHVESAMAVVQGNGIRPHPVMFCVDRWADALKSTAREILLSRLVCFSKQIEVKTFHSDPDKLNEIACILIDNAAKHAGQAEVAIYVQCTASEFILRVSDTGPGIEPDQLIRIFDPFVRASGQPGLGIGLYLARQIANALGGDLGVSSNPGKGSCFELAVQAAADTESQKPLTRVLGFARN